MFQVLAQLSENFIFIDLGLTLFTDDKLVFNPVFILVTIVGICIARYAAVFPLSKAINWVIRYRAKRRGKDVADELPHSYQVLLFWAGLRGAVGVALAAGLQEGTNQKALQATVLVVVVLTVIIFGGTTARMLEIMGIRTGVVDEIDSDDEFDIETATNGTYYKRGGAALGNVPQRNGASVPLDKFNGQSNGGAGAGYSGYSSGSSSGTSPPVRPASALSGRKNSLVTQKDKDAAQRKLLGIETGNPSDDDSDSDLPPAVTKAKRKPSTPAAGPSTGSGRSPYPYSASGVGSSTHPAEAHLSASGAISQLIHGTSDDHAAWFKQIDEGFIKPKLLLDQNDKGGGGDGGV